MGKSKTVNLTSGNVWKTLLLYCLPLFGSALVQQLYSLVDLLVVGNFAKEGALAVDAIGNATVIINILLAFALGANGGCSVVVARHFGENDFKKVRETVNTSLISASALCAAIMALGFGLGNVSLSALGVHGNYFDDCLEYLYIYIGSLPFVFLYNLGCGICSALGDSKTPFIFLAISSVMNVGLDICFVYLLHWDVAGAAWATFISQAVSCALTLFVLMRKVRSIKSEEKPKTFDKKTVKNIVYGSFLLPLLMYITPSQKIIEDDLLAVIVGGAVFAIGVAALYRINASSGGTTVPPLIFKKYFHIDPAFSLLALDMLVTFFNIFVSGLNAFFMASFSLVITSIVMRYTEAGLDHKYQIQVMSQTKLPEIKKCLSLKIMQ